MTKSEIMAYPNPFTERTTIDIRLQTTDKNQKSSVSGLQSLVSLNIYNLSGRLIRQFNHLTNQPINQIVWDGSDKGGEPVPGGIYFCQLKSGDFSETRKLILLR